MEILQAFTLVQTPLIITSIEEGMNMSSIVTVRSGGGHEAQNVLLTYEDGAYTNIADGEIIDSIDELEGIAIICDDLVADLESEEYLTLAK